MYQDLDITNTSNANEVINTLTTATNKITIHKRINPEIEFFLNENGEIKYHAKCMKCKHHCKQSWRCKNVYCHKFAKINDEINITE